MIRKELAEEIETLVDGLYHGHTVASSIRTMREDQREGKLKVTLHDIAYPSGEPKRGDRRFASISVRDDVLEWLEQERKKQHDAYLAKYGKAGVARLGPFAARLLLNMLLSKKDQVSMVLKLRPGDYEFLRGQFEKSKGRYGVDNFEQFLPLFIRDAVRKMGRE